MERPGSIGVFGTVSTEDRIPFDRFTLDLETRELGCDGQKLILQEKLFRLLVALLDRRGRVVTRTELYNVLWPENVHVDREAGLNTAVRKLRAAMRDLSGGDCAFLETVPRVGYRLVASEPPPQDGDHRGERGGQPGDEEASSGEASPTGDESKTSRFATLPLFAGFAPLVVLAALGFAVLDRRPGASAEPMPQDPDQRSRYIEARSLIGAPNGDIDRARTLLRSLIQAEPEFAPGHAYLAEACLHFAVRTDTIPDFEEARSAARKAHELDPDLAVAHRVLAQIALIFDWDIGTAGTRLDRALALEPEDPENHLVQAAYSSVLGQHQEAITAIRRAVELDPDSMAVRGDAGYFLLRAGRFEEAAAECEMVLRLDPKNGFARVCLLAAHSAAGDFDSARPHAMHLLTTAGASEADIEAASTASDPQRVYLAWRLEYFLGGANQSPLQIAAAYIALDDPDRALTWLERAARERSPLLVFVPHAHTFSELRADPRYRRILQDAGLESLIWGTGDGRGRGHRT